MFLPRKKQTLISAITILAFVASTMAAQCQDRVRSSAEIEVAGHKLHLGMSKAQVIAKLAGTEFTKINDDEWMVGSFEKKELGPTLQFSRGLLTFADRYWVTYDNDIADALFGAVRTLNEEGFSRCTVTADAQTDPGMSAHRVWIACAEKTVLLVRRTMGDKSYNTVYEQLGTMKVSKD